MSIFKVFFLYLSNYSNFKVAFASLVCRRYISPNTMGYFFAFKIPLQMLYSHLNPFVYLIVLKKFQQYHIDVLTYCKKFLFFESVSVENDVSSKVNKSPKSCCEKNQIKSILGLTLLSVAVSGLGLTTYCQFNGENDASVVKAHYAATLRQKFQLQNRLKIRSSLDYSQLQPYSHYADKKCDENQAVFNYNRKRCYFVMEFGYLGYNLTESIEQCRSRGAVLSYPRKWEEVGVTWMYFKSHLLRNDVFNEKDFLANTTLHVGFIRTGKINFQSVDKKMIVSTLSHPILLEPVQTTDFLFKGPAICINKYRYLKRCMPRMRSQFAVCSLDLR